MRKMRCAFAMACGALLHAPGIADVDVHGELIGPAETMPLGNRAGDPAEHLPAGAELISSFGERPVFSPDGRKIAFIGQSYGDAFEYDIASGAIRNLTAHMPHKGFLRVHYLHDGSFLLLGPHETGTDRQSTRGGLIELWWMDASASRPAQRLHVRVFEGLALSTRSNRIAWTEVPAGGTVTSAMSSGDMTMKTAEVVVTHGKARLDNERTLFSAHEVPGCAIEAQDFLPGDKGLTFPCYMMRSEATRPGTRVMSFDFVTRRFTTYPTPPQLYGEVEGIFPDGQRTLVECSGDRSAGMDLCLLELKPVNPSYRRLTRIMDFGRWKYGNPVVSPDGRMIAAQIGSADVIDAGVGQGIVVMHLPPAF